MFFVRGVRCLISSVSVSRHLEFFKTACISRRNNAAFNNMCSTNWFDTAYRYHSLVGSVMPAGEKPQLGWIRLLVGYHSLVGYTCWWDTTAWSDMPAGRIPQLGWIRLLVGYHSLVGYTGWWDTTAWLDTPAIVGYHSLVGYVCWWDTTAWLDTPASGIPQLGWIRLLCGIPPLVCPTKTA